MASKSDTASRQQYVTIRRKESGLVTKKYHLHQEAVDKLHDIGKSMGYSNSELKKNENLSAILEVCIDVFSDRSFKGKESSKDSLRLKQLHKIIKFRENEGYTDESTAEFLEYWCYQTPRLIKKSNDQGIIKKKRYKLTKWSAKTVANIKNHQYLEEQIKHLNKRPARATKPKKISEPQKRKKRDDEFLGYLL